MQEKLVTKEDRRMLWAQNYLQFPPISLASLKNSKLLEITN